MASKKDSLKSDEPMDRVPDNEPISEGSRLLAPQVLVDLLAETKEHIQGEIIIDGIPIPRFGLLSLKCLGVPMFVYGRDFKPFQDEKKYGKEAFSTGYHMFIHADWLWSMMRWEEEYDGEAATIPYLLHMLFHQQKNHDRRLLNFETDVAENAKDMHVWTNLRVAFGPESERRDKLNIAKMLKERYRGFGEKDVEEYHKLSEETIAKRMQSEKRQKQDQKKDQQQGGDPKQQKKDGQPGSNGQPDQGQPGGGGQQPKDGQPGQGQPGGGQPQNNQQGQGGGQPQDNQSGQGGGQPEPGDFGGIHNVPIQSVIKDLEDGGYQDVLNTLRLPSSDDLEGLGKMEERTKMKDLENLSTAASQMAQVGGKYPGAHIVEAESERVKSSADGKMSWDLGLRELILGDGKVWQNSWDGLADLAYVDPEDMGRDFDDPLMLPENIPHKPDGVVVIIIDTSGSVTTEMLKMFFAEVFGLKKSSSGASDMAKEIVVFSADTVVRGEPLEITDDNYEQLVESGVGVFGRGGTDFATSLRMVAASDVMKEKKILGVVYMTDLCAARPNKEDFPVDVPVAFITAPHDYDIEFANHVKGWARVYAITDNTKVRLDADFLDDAVDQSPGPKGRRP